MTVGRRAGERSSEFSGSAPGEQGVRRKLTINDIARLANVSKKTVSRVINDSPSVKGETREKINAVIAEMGYAPDPQARGLAFRRSFLIGMIFNNPNPQYVLNMQQGILDALRGTGYELVVHPCDRGNANYLEDIQTFVERQRLYGVILPPSISEDEKVAEALRGIGCEFVRIASVSLDEPRHMIVSHDRIGGRDAARHLVSLGHRRLAYITGPSNFRSSHERRGGFEDGLAEAGLTLEERYVGLGAYTFESGVACGAELLRMDEPPSAIFCGNDEMAVGVLQAARQLGLRVPEDVSVVGYDDFQIASRTWPLLTTVHTPTREVGRLAAEQLLGLAEPGRALSEEHLPRLVIRESSGPCPSS